MKAQPPDYYGILGVSPKASRDEITTAFNSRVRRFPKESRDPARNKPFRRLVAAFKILSDPENRRVYDQSLRRLAQSPSLNLQLFASQTALPALKEQQVQYLLLDVSADQSIVSDRAALNLCLVIDRSTSMQGERISAVKAAADRIIDQLEPDDTISLISFSDRAEVVAPATSASNSKLIKSRLSQMAPSGATEILQGLQAGLHELRRLQDQSAVSHLILLTDGHTYGDEPESIELAIEASKQGVGITAVGIGHEWNDSFLDALVAPSGGTSLYLETPDKLKTLLEERISSLNRTAAKNLMMELTFPLPIQVRSIHTLSPSPRPIDHRPGPMPLGNLDDSAPLSVLMEVIAEPQPPKSSLGLEVGLSADIIATSERGKRFMTGIRLQFEANPPRKPPLPAVVRAVNQLNLYRMNEKAWEDLQQGRADQASVQMERLSARLMNAGQTNLARAARVEADHIARTGRHSEQGRKKLKYGTRALIGHDNLR